MDGMDELELLRKHVALQEEVIAMLRSQVASIEASADIALREIREKEKEIFRQSKIIESLSA